MVQAGYDYANRENQYAQEPNRHDRRLKKKTAVKTNKKKNVITRLSIIVFAYALLLVYLCIKSATLGYEIVSLENEINRINNENHRLEYAIAQNTSLEIIENKAMTQLGMISPGMDLSYAVAVASEQINPVLKVENDNTIAENKPLEKLYASIMLLTGKNNL